MTTLELTKHIIPHCNPNKLSGISMEQGMEIASAITLSLAEYFTYMPLSRRKANCVVELCGPKQIEVEVTECSNELILSEDFDHSLVGSTIIIGCERHEISGPTTILQTYKGQSGPETATIYHDAIAFNEDRVINRLVTDPILVGGNGRSQRQLCRVPRDYAPDATHGFYNSSSWADSSSSWYQHNWACGDPTHYALLETGNSRGGPEWFTLKFTPAPQRPITLRFDLDFDHDVICWSQLTNFPVDLPISDTDIHSILLPFIRFELFQSSTVWEGNERVNANMAESHARAHGKIKMKHSDRAPTQRGLGTPYGR